VFRTEQDNNNAPFTHFGAFEMLLTDETMLAWCRRLTGVSDDAPRLPLEDYLKAIPRFDALRDIPSGTPVLVRGDLDAKPGPNIGDGDIRLRSMVDTLNEGRERGWVQIIFGHIGRKPEGTLVNVAARLGELLDTEIELLSDWFDETSLIVPAAISEKIRTSAPGTVLMLENTRRYDIERSLWKAGAEQLPSLSQPLAKFAQELADNIAKVYVHEALSAGSFDASSTIVPAAMQRVAMGRYLASEMDGPMLRCRRSQLVIFSGLKIDKMDDLEAIVGRGLVRMVIAAGSLAMSLKKASAQLDGGDFCLGVAENPEHSEKPYYIGPDRIKQARDMVKRGRAHSVEFVLPVDFILADGSTSQALAANDQQFDVGPKSSALFEQKVGQFIDSAGNRDDPLVAFHNGVFGMFEDPRFESGTKRFIAQLKRMTDANVEVYVGGGEGGKALERYGKPDWITHCFTAGGTVLNALGNEPIPYLQALYLAVQHSDR